MTSCSTGTFKLLVQFLYTSQINLDEATDDKRRLLVKQTDAEPMSQKITRLLDFLVVADQIQLLGPFDNITEMIKQSIVADRSSLVAAHIRTAASLQKHHGTRKLFAKACAKDYLQGLYRPRQMKFSAELDELDGFAADVLREIPRLKGFSSGLYFMDPLTDEEISL